MRRNPQSILITLTSVSIVLLLIVVLFNSQALQRQYQLYSRAVQSEVILENSHSLFQTIRHYGYERGYVSVLLNFQGSIAEMQSSIEVLRQHQEEGDRELSNSLKRLNQLSQYKNHAFIKQIIAHQKKISLLRGQYKQQLLLPFEKRDHQLDDLWFNTMSEHLQQIKFLLFQVKQKHQWFPRQKHFAQAYYLLAQLRDHAGPMCSHLKAASINGSSLTEQRIDEIKERAKSVDDYLGKLTFISSEILGQETFNAVEDFRQHYLEQTYPLAQNYIESVQSGIANPQLEKDYFGIAVESLEKLNEIGIVLQKSCAVLCQKSIAEQLTRLWIGIIASLSSFIIILYSLYLLYRRIYLRIVSSSIIMDQLTQGNLDIEIQPAEIPDEIGAIEEGLASFKENLIAIVDKNGQLKNEIDERIAAESRRDQLEIELRQKNKMEAVGFLAGGMAHNFNNNLSIILGNVELSQMKQPPGSEVTQLLENAKIAVRRSRDLVQKIITYSRKGVTHKAPVQIQTVVDDTIDLLRSTLPTTIILQKSYSSDCSDDLINADASQIQEALINLASNAVRAMDEKGELKISLEPVELEQKNIPAQYDCLPGHYLKLSVQDSGCGMPAEMLDKIFDPFYSTKEDYEGAGMGLATVQGIVAQHGGIIKVNSVLSQGTEFDLYFPIMQKTSIDKPAVKESILTRGTERILFVDDDENLASLGEKLLGTLGYQVSMMTDSSEALKMFTANADQFDLVITDQTMPYITGQELIADIRKVRADIPTILCTGYSSKIDEQEAAEFGISAFLMKPLDLPLLSQTIRRVLDGDEVS